MIAYLFYNKDSEGARRMSELSRRLVEQDVECELVDADSPRGVMLAENYDILSRPAIVLSRLDGTMVERWQDDLPTPADISYLAHS